MLILLLLLSILILILLYPRWSQAFAIKRWRDSLSLDKHRAAYLQLYSKVNGFALSRDARSTHDAIEYTYGEIDFISFIALLSLTRPDSNTVFYDLGSGTGTAALACAMVFNVQESNGIELFSTLHKAACEQQNALSRLPDYKAAAKTIRFIHGNFLDFEYSNATLVFINATGFFGSTWGLISQRIEQTTHCKTVITTSKALKSNAFIIKKITTVQMSWGVVRAYIQERKKIS